jgi:S1-C subfamily serine protease
MKIIKAISIPLLILLLSSCTQTYKVVGTFNDFNEVVLGTVVADLSTGGGTFSAKGKNSDLSCDGYASPPHIIPGLFSCAGQQGKGSAQCDDGRSIEFDWVAESCTWSHGAGKDSMGNNFYFTAGLDEEAANKYIKEKMIKVEDKPDFPAYLPKETRKKVGYSTGTGFFVSDNGIIVTNYHVIEDAESLTIKTNNSTFNAEVLATDPVNDVAILKIASNSKPIPISNYFNVKKGEEVLTLGYPRIDVQGQEQKATFGRVNSLSGIKGDVRLTQIDVPIQPGNSGGPLLNKKGEVVGIVTATLDSIVILRQSGSLPQNVNFAVKVDYIIPLLRQTIDKQFLDDNNLKEQEMYEIVENREDSVVLVIAK